MIDMLVESRGRTGITKDVNMLLVVENDIKGDMSCYI